MSALPVQPRAREEEPTPRQLAEDALQHFERALGLSANETATVPNTASDSPPRRPSFPDLHPFLVKA